MKKLTMKSVDLTQTNIDKIAELFPNVITEARDEQGKIKQAVNFDLLKQELSDVLVEGEKERYQLTWPGKKQAILNANTPIDKTLRPVKEDSVGWDNTQNLYIEGDNLEVLKLLQESYLNKIKCIYIDPPYNTGKDFIYRDDFSEPVIEYLEESGQLDEEGNRLIQNTEANGRFHSDWLTMMYSRLKIARNLLREDGVLFISIGKDELSNLVKLSDEIMGESNRLAIIGRVAKTASNNGTHFAPSIDYIACYGKNINTLSSFYDDVDVSLYKKIETEGPRKGERYRDDIALYQSSQKDLRPNQKYFIECPDGTKVIPPCSIQDEVMREGDGRWRWTKEKYLQNKHLLVFKRTNSSPLVDADGNKANWNIYTKSYLSERQLSGTLPRDIWLDFINRKGADLLKKMDIPFDFSKPVELVSYILKIIRTTDNDIILDFFSGSATTAHAVIQSNAEDNGKRKYIMVQLPEKTDVNSEAYKAGYKNICEIGKERIRRAAKKIKEETGADIDYGFRVFRVDSSNMKDVYYTPDKLKQGDMFDLASNIKEDRTGEDLLIQVMLELGLELSLPMETKQLEGKIVHYVAGNSLIACFEDNVPESVMKQIAAEKPLRVVFRDSSFEDDSARINVEELFKMLSPGTEIQVL